MRDDRKTRLTSVVLPFALVTPPALAVLWLLTQAHLTALTLGSGALLLTLASLRRT